MGTTTLLSRSAMRGRGRSHIALATLLIVGVGTALASLTAAWRTDHAYSDFLQRSNVSQLVINPLLITDRLLEAIRTTPGVDSISVIRFLNLQTTDIDQATQDEYQSFTQPIGTDAHRYFDVDRPTIIEGRMISSANEIFINRGAAKAYGLKVGDQLSFTFVPAQPSDADPPLDLPPIGQEHVTVVGIGVFADEVLPDDLYANIKIIFSPEMTAKYSCITTQPESGDPRPLEELRTVFFPTNCSSDATLISLRVAGGDAGVPAVLAALDERVAAENAELPIAMRQNNFGFQVIPTITSAETERVRRSVEPVVLALRLLGIAVLAATIIVAAALAHRTTRDTESDAQIWSQLGVARGQRMVAVAAPTAIVIAGALALSLVAGWLASGIGPVASVEVLDPAHALGIPAAVTAAVIPGALVLLLAALTLSAWLATSARARRVPRHGTNRLADAAARTGDVPLALGVHAAVRGRSRPGTGLLLGAAVVAIAVGTGALVYSTNLLSLVSHPVRYGWTYDIGATINSGYNGADEDQIARTLDRPEVAGWGVAATAYSATIDGVKLPAIADMRGLADLGLPMLHGALPHGDHEVALGSISADRLGVSVGDQVAVETDFGERDATVTGIAVLPAIGTFLSDRTSLGTGIFFSAPFFQAVISDAESAAGVEPGAFYNNIGGFLAVDLHNDVDAAAFVKAIGDDDLTWDIAGNPPIVHLAPVRPAQIADIASVKSAPLLLSALIALTIVIGLMAGLGRAIKTRRRELAVLRALGCRRTQLYATVSWQAVTTVAIGLVVGIPLGLIAGSAVWRSFASNLGILTAPELPWTWIAVVATTAVVIAIVSAMMSGHRATADRPATVLREG